MKVLATESTSVSVFHAERTWVGSAIRQMAACLGLCVHELGVLQSWRQQLAFWLDVLLSRRLRGDDVLSIRGIGNVLRLVGQVWEQRQSVWCVSLWSLLFLDCSSLLLTCRKKKKTGQARSLWTCLPSLFLLLNLPVLKGVFHAYLKLRWLTHMFFVFFKPRNKLCSKTERSARIMVRSESESVRIS